MKYDEKSFVIDIEEAMQPDAPLVFDAPIERQEDGGDVGVVHDGSKGQGNLRGPSTSSFYGGPRGDIEQGFAEADVIVRENLQNPGSYPYAFRDTWCGDRLETQ